MSRLSAVLVAAALSVATAASAQTTWRVGLRAGAHRATTTLGDIDRVHVLFAGSYSAASSALYAGQAGLVLEARSGKLAWQPALVFSQKGEKQVSTTAINGVAGTSYFQTVSTNRYNWLELPLNVVYTPCGDHGWQVFAGPYVAVAVGGRQKGDRTSFTIFSSSVPAPAPTIEKFDTAAAYGSATVNQRWDAGFNAGLGYRQGPVQVQLGYGLGLANLRKGTYEPAARNRVVQLTATYLWGK